MVDTRINQLTISIRCFLQARVAEKEAMERNTPRMGRPKPLPPLRSIPVHPPLNDKSNNRYCNMDSCFDYSFCPLSSKFRFYLYPYMFSNLSFITIPDSKSNGPTNYPYSGPTVEILHQMLARSPYTTRDPNKACIFIILVDICDPQRLSQLRQQLPNWYGDGRNHVILVIHILKFHFISVSFIFSTRPKSLSLKLLKLLRNCSIFDYLFIYLLLDPQLDCGINFRHLYTPDFFEFFGRSLIASENGIVTSYRDEFDLGKVDLINNLINKPR